MERQMLTCIKCKLEKKVKCYSSQVLCRPCYQIEKELHLKLERNKAFLLPDITKINEKYISVTQIVLWIEGY
jgi:hypothetical protein